MNPLRCQKWAKGHSRSQEEEYLCCGGGPEEQGLPHVSALQDSVKLQAKSSHLNSKSIFPSTVAFSRSKRERLQCSAINPPHDRNAEFFFSINSVIRK